MVEEAELEKFLGKKATLINWCTSASREGVILRAPSRDTRTKYCIAYFHPFLCHDTKTGERFAPVNYCNLHPDKTLSIDEFAGEVEMSYRDTSWKNGGGSIDSPEERAAALEVLRKAGFIPPTS
jgi:hypothetical protein